MTSESKFPPNADVAAATLMEKIVRDAYPAKKSSAIQPLQWSILRYLARRDRQESDLKSIKFFIGVTSAPITRAVKTLESRLLVEKHANPNEGRSIIVKLTAIGVEALAKDPILKVASSIESLPREEQECFRKALRRLALGQTETSE